MLGPTSSSPPRAAESPDEAEAAGAPVAPAVGDDSDIAATDKAGAGLVVFPEDDDDQAATPWREAIGGAEGDPLPLDELPVTASDSARAEPWKDWVIDPYARDEYGDDGDRTYDAHATEYGAAARKRLARRSRNRDNDGDYEPGRRRSGGARIIGTLAAVVVTVGLVVVVIGVNVGAGASKTSSAAIGAGTTDFAVPVASTTVEVGPAGPLIAPESFAHATGDCTRTRSAALTSGAGRGDDKDAGGVILAFEWAYYVDRSASAIYGLMAPGAELGADVSELQTYLDTKLPADTRYCVRITPHGLSGNSWLVDIDEQRPGSVVEHLAPQVFTTTISGGKPLIISVAEK